MAMCSSTQYGLVGCGIMRALICVSFLLISVELQAQVDDDLKSEISGAQSVISEVDRAQREVMSHLFTLNKEIKHNANRRGQLSSRLMECEANVRSAIQDMQTLESKSTILKERLNKRLRSLYQTQGRHSFQWAFSAQSPMAFDRSQRFMKKIIDSDHEALGRYVLMIRALDRKRARLKSLVTELAQAQKELAGHEKLLMQQQMEKQKVVAKLRASKQTELDRLKDLRHQTSEFAQVPLALFERKGQLSPPIEGSVLRGYGAYVDPDYHFRLMHKGNFYHSDPGQAVSSIAAAKVAFAGRLPGYGRAVILDHGDNYYSVYAFLKKLYVVQGGEVLEGKVLAEAGGVSPLYGPGFYFELRHFSEVLDPSDWLATSPIKTALDLSAASRRAH